MSKVIIDLSGNGGGFVTLGQNLAMQFFPESDHFFGSNMRWNPALQVMLTSDVDPNATYWDIGHYKKMDGSDFKSYQEFLGPVHRDNDYFTVIGVPDTVESIAETGVHMPSSYDGPQPFDTDNIVLVSPHPTYLSWKKKLTRLLAFVRNVWKYMCYVCGSDVGARRAFCELWWQAC